MEIVRVESLTKEYRLGRRYSVRALDGVTLGLERGEFAAIVGPSGSGKSTLLHLIGCLDTPTSGRVLLNELDVQALSRERLPELRNRMIGFIFQQHHLIPSFTALENVMLPLRYARVPRIEARRRALELLEEVGLQERWRHRPAELSGGQQQRVAIARSLACRPAIILADEPTGELDSGTSTQIVDMLLRLSAEHGQTFVVVTHNPEVAARCRRVIHLRDGSVVGDSRFPPKDLGVPAWTGAGRGSLL